ncbi:helix-turn-helix transcriptional regulator [Limosilactobacillus reuteri]|uniref:helix-turn-helix transcriptional regulator n=1 Tax=Limosilactobacillus reuteri TaxID=1598 RepID=UPI00298C4879|nr:hypothetical protein [Limosilactobacillus reuteri]
MIDLYGTNLLNARQLASALNVCNTTLFKMLHQTNRDGEHCPYHQLGSGRKYYVLEEVQQWLLN